MHRRGRRQAGTAFVAILGAAAVLLSGCGASSRTTTKTVTAPAQTQPAPATPAVSYTTYRAELYSVQVPAGWTQETDQRQHSAYVESKWHDPRDPGTSLTIDASPNVTGTAGDQAASVRAALARLSDYRELGYGQVPLAGKDGWKWTFQISGDQRVDYFLTDCSTGIAVLGSTTPSHFASHQETFAHVADSVAIRCVNAGTSTTTPSTSTTPPSTSTTTSPATLAQTCTVKAWYTGTGFSARYGYIHFKCVDDKNGTTVAEALGSDNIDFAQEQQFTRRTAKREQLIDQLTAKLEGAGWRELGTVANGQWYQLRFGR